MRAETDDHAVHGRHAFGVVTPLKGAVGELDLDALRQHPAPEHADLFAWGDGVGGHKGAARVGAGFTVGQHVASGFDVPGGHQIQEAGVVQVAKGVGHVGALRVV